MNDISPRRAPGYLPPAVQLTSLEKRFGTVTAVAGLDLTIRAGEVVAFLGPNGAGKTTTIDILLGLSQPTSGDVEVFGGTPADAVARGWVAAVMQTGGLLKDLTVAETVRLTASLMPQPRPAAEVMERAGLTALASRRVDRCSGGEKQRLRFAMALLADPRLLILDEPTTGMDVEARRAFWAAIRQDAAAGRTIMFATHYLDEADSYADRIVMVRHGQVVADGTPAQIRAMASGRVVRATWPGADPRWLAALPAVTDAQVRGEGIMLRCSDSDAVLRALLDHSPARDLEVTAHNLEDAFVALTSDDSAQPPAAELAGRALADQARSAS